MGRDGELLGVERWLSAGQNRFGIPFWLVGEFTTHFRTYFSGWIESDVHWGYDLGFDPWPPATQNGSPFFGLNFEHL